MEARASEAQVFDGDARGRGDEKGGERFVFVVANVQVQGADAARTAVPIVLPKGPIVEDAGGIGVGSRGRRSAGRGIHVGGVGEPEIVVGEAGVHFTGGGGAAHINNGGSARAALGEYFVA